MNYKLVEAGALAMVRAALSRDAEEGKVGRSEMLAELDAATKHVEIETANLHQVCAALARMVNTFGTSHTDLPLQPTNAQVATQMARDALAAFGKSDLIKDHLINAGQLPVPEDWNPNFLTAS